MERLGRCVEKTGMIIYAWALIPNHFHILIRSGPKGLSHFMRRLLTGYAVSFNKRHKRAGHLFQNRYTSIVCEEDSYFMELVRYIHLNPVRAHVIHTLEELDSYPWSGHRTVMSEENLSWQDTAYVLQWFGNSKEPYRAFLRRGLDGPEPDLEGGGLIRSSGGRVIPAQRRNPVLADQRVLGSGGIVEHLLRTKLTPKSLTHKERQRKADEILHARCKEGGVTLNQLQNGNRQRYVSRIRSEIARILIAELGLSCAETARKLGVSTVAAWKMVNGKS